MRCPVKALICFQGHGAGYLVSYEAFPRGAYLRMRNNIFSA